MNGKRIGTNQWMMLNGDIVPYTGQDGGQVQPQQQAAQSDPIAEIMDIYAMQQRGLDSQSQQATPQQASMPTTPPIQPTQAPQQAVQPSVNDIMDLYASQAQASQPAPQAPQIQAPTAPPAQPQQTVNNVMPAQTQMADTAAPQTPTGGRLIQTPMGQFWQDGAGNTVPYTGQDQAATPQAPPAASPQQPQAPPSNPTQVQPPPTPAPPPSTPQPPAAPSTSGGQRPPGSPNDGIALRLTNGEWRRSSNIGEIDSLIAQGAQPIGEEGNNIAVSRANGGTLLDGVPINTALTGQIRQDQYDALQQAGTLRPDIQTSQITATGGIPATGATGGGGTTGGTTGGSTGGDPNDLYDLYEMEDLPQLGSTTLPGNPQISGSYSPDFYNNYLQQNAQGINDIPNYYNWGDWPTAQAAQMDQGAIPQTQAQTPQSFDALDFLLSGQGFGNDVMSKMRAGVIDDNAAAGRSQRGSSKLLAEQSGLAGSPAALALESQANRNQNASTTRGLNDLEVQNAQQGLENKRIGAGMEMGRQTSSAEMMNQNALANASRLFSGMQQNVQNSQQANMTNAGFTQDRNMQRANTQAQMDATSHLDYNKAQLAKGAEADVMNANNTINRNLNQAQLDRQQGMFNIGNTYGQYTNAQNNMVALANNSNPAGYYGAAGSIGAQYTPNLGYSNAVTNVAGAVARNNNGIGG